MTNEDGNIQYEISDGGAMTYRVVHTVSSKSAICNCNRFIQLGVLCKHIFLVFKDMKMEIIPDQYIVSRWTRSACLRPIFQIDGSVVDQTTDIEGMKLVVNQLWGDFYTCLQMAEGNMERLTGLRNALKQQKEIFHEAGVDYSGRIGKQKVVENYCGTITPGDTIVLPPMQAKNKGSGKRLKGGKEKAEALQTKPKRICSTCKQLGHHDARNCPYGVDSGQ